MGCRQLDCELDWSLSLKINGLKKDIFGEKNYEYFS